MSAVRTVVRPIHFAGIIDQWRTRLRRRLAAVRYFNVAWLAWQADDKSLAEATWRIAQQIESGTLVGTNKLPWALTSRIRPGPGEGLTNINRRRAMRLAAPSHSPYGTAEQISRRDAGTVVFGEKLLSRATDRR